MKAGDRDWLGTLGLGLGLGLGESGRVENSKKTDKIILELGLGLGLGLATTPA